MSRLHRHRPVATARRQAGAALVVGLILLLLLTILAISGVVTSTLELRMAGNQQLQERAFQAAEVGVEIAMSEATGASGTFEVGPVNVSDPAAPCDGTGDCLQYVLRSIEATEAPTSPVGYSVPSFSAYHYEVEAVGTTPNGATSEHVQGFYILGPS